MDDLKDLQVKIGKPMTKTEFEAYRKMNPGIQVHNKNSPPEQNPKEILRNKLKKKTEARLRHTEERDHRCARKKTMSTRDLALQALSTDGPTNTS